MSHHKYSPNTERAAECQTLVEEIQLFFEELPKSEQTFIQQIDERLTKWGQATYISDDQYKWIQDIYERVC